MEIYLTMRAFARAHELLDKRGIYQQEAAMVLFAMLYEGISYTEALRSYAEYAGKRPDWMESRMESAARMAGHRNGIRYVLEECYREAIQ